MFAHAGVERNKEGLQTLIKDIVRLKRSTMGRAPFANMLTTSLMIATAAYLREESRGGHFRSDFPSKASNAVRTTMTLDSARSIADKIANDERTPNLQPAHEANR